MATTSAEASQAGCSAAGSEQARVSPRGGRTVLPVPAGVLISGRGSNLQALIDARAAGELPVDFRIVVSDRRAAQGLERARAAGIEAAFVSAKGYATRRGYDLALADLLDARGVELVVLAGFMRVLCPEFLERFSCRVINIHPALLPSFAGTEAQAQALARGVKVSGCTVHFVDAGVDTGPIIAQRCVPVAEDDTVESLSARILEQEHLALPLAVRLYAEGRLEIENGRVRVLPQRAME